MQLFQDRICSSRPLEGLAVGIVVSDKLVDALNQLLLRIPVQRDR